jgi:hypothetical protein
MIALLGLFGLMLPLAAVILSALTGVALLGNVLRIKKDRKTE